MALVISHSADVVSRIPFGSLVRMGAEFLVTPDVVARVQRYQQQFVESVTGAPSLGISVPYVVHGLGDELEGRAILLIRGVRAGLSLFSILTYLTSYGLTVA